jgi:O-antigen/teichoic acid export membrane protein
MGVMGVVYGNLISSALAGVSLSAAFLIRVRGAVSRKKFQQMFRYGAPLIVQSLASFVLVFSDRFFLRHFASLSEVGIYGLGYKLAGVVSLLVSGPFSMTWSWQQFELAKKENAKEMYAKIQVYQLVVLVFAGLAVVLLAKDVLRIMTPPAYWAAARVVPLITLSYILNDMRAVVLSGVLVRNLTHHIAWISAIAAAANLTLNYVLVSRYSTMGAALATVLTYALILLLSYLIAQRVYFIHYDYVRNLIILGSAIGVYIASTAFDFQLVGSVLLNIVLLLLFAGTTLLSFKQDERKMFRALGVSTFRRLQRFTLRAG